MGGGELKSRLRGRDRLVRVIYIPLRPLTTSHLITTPLSLSSTSSVNHSSTSSSSSFFSSSSSSFSSSSTTISFSSSPTRNHILSCDMRASRPLFASRGGFLSRTYDELRRRSSIAWNLEAVKGSARPRPLYDFKDASAVGDCIVMSDDLIGGSSQSNLDHISLTDSLTCATTEEDSSPPSSYARFHGSISVSLPSDRPSIRRSGYGAFRTPDQGPTLFGRSFWDVDPYIYLALRVKSDGRAYFVNLQTESVEPSDLHQHRLFVKRPGQWETVFIRWNDFIRTNYGFVVEPQTELLRQKVCTLGIGLTDRVEGPFELCVERAWATNDASAAVPMSDEESQLRNRRGESISW
ncbi:hypothetical protein L249_8229 [Ophiocordyceps polyrhachis-furcata BCC 54312]|uniref:NADH:ubiquinone oxidoreductase intermediate-associated protein 30 domain-containing protein n=1 Tax=Ophiocordyceps polyrhachis-furcata BCC 54312 TaxID=1330021 RepID=A0A367LHL7_9HYPO|nr:hypothetical protein L249_8229 [Ophiocordyceps polyrhachis-furcata BCC 54312]